MSMKNALERRLLDTRAIADRVGARVGWSRRLEGLPAITMQVIADPRPQHLKGFQRTRATQVQLDVWAASEDQAEEIRELCIEHLTPAALIDGIKFQRAMIDNVRSGAEPEQSGQPQRSRGELFRESIDFTFTHNA